MENWRWDKVLVGRCKFGTRKIGMVINPIIGVYISITRIPYSRWDDHPQYKEFRPWGMISPKELVARYEESEQNPPVANWLGTESHNEWIKSCYRTFMFRFSPKNAQEMSFSIFVLPPPKLWLLT